MRVAERDNLLEAGIQFLNLLRLFAKSILAEKQLNVGVLKKIRRLGHTDVRRKGNNNIAAENHSGQAGDVLIICASDESNVNALLFHRADIAADRKAVLAEFAVAFLCNLSVPDIAAKVLAAVFVCGIINKLSDSIYFAHIFISSLYFLLILRLVVFGNSVSLVLI